MNNFCPPDQLPSSPRLWNIPHDSFRPAQGAAIVACRTLYAEGGGFIFQELPTGVGKSSVATALGVDDKITVLVHTLSLLYQYETKYGFDVLAGKAQYQCALPDDDERIIGWKSKHPKGDYPTAAECFHAKMSECEFAGDCPYLIAKAKALASRRMACTLPYAMLSEQVAHRGGILVVDEAHSVVEGLLGFTEFTIDQGVVDRFDLPSLPFSRSPRSFGPRGKGDVADGAMIRTIESWLEASVHSLSWIHDNWRMALDPDGDRAKRLYERLIRLRDTLAESGSSWFAQAGPDAVRAYYKGNYRDVPGLFLKALDARSAAQRLWSHKRMALFMSATIGKADSFATELGIDKYKFETYPHPIAPEYRPIFDLKFARMTAEQLKSRPDLYESQARVVAAFIRSLDPSWRGIVMTSSNYKIDRLRGHLTDLLGDRIMQPGRASLGGERTTKEIDKFIADPRKGLVFIGSIQGHANGLDLRDDTAKFSIIAGLAHTNPTDPYSLARIKIPGAKKYAQQVTYNGAPQGCSRVSRGELESDGTPALNVAALACGTATTEVALRAYPTWFREAII